MISCAEKCKLDSAPVLLLWYSCSFLFVPPCSHLCKVVSSRFSSSSLPLQTFPNFGRLPLPRKPIWRWSGQCWKTLIKREPEAEGVPQQFPGLLQLVHQLFRCPVWKIRFLHLQDSFVQHTGEECDLMSRLPVRRKERSKVTASVLTSGSKNVALK